MAGIGLGGSIAADFGSKNLYILSDENEQPYSCASLALVSSENITDVYAVGDDALRMDGRTGDDAVLVSPVNYGGVADSELSAMLLLSAAEKAVQRRRPFDNGNLVLSVPCGATRVERAALGRAAELAGAKHALVVKAPLAAAAALGCRIDKAEGQLVVTIGANVTEITVISAFGIALSRHIKVGSSLFDEAIGDFIRANHGLIVPDYTAESIKKDMGSAVKEERSANVTLRGLNVKTGRPSSVSIASCDIYNVLQQPLRYLTGRICDALFSIPAEFSSDILKNGVYLTGGGSMLHGFDKMLEDALALPVHQSAEPAFDTVKGLMKIAGDSRLCHGVLSAGSAYEI